MILDLKLFVAVQTIDRGSAVICFQIPIPNANYLLY